VGTWTLCRPEPRWESTDTARLVAFESGAGRPGATVDASPRARRGCRPQFRFFCRAGVAGAAANGFTPKDIEMRAAIPCMVDVRARLRHMGIFSTNDRTRSAPE
jgi:hypothetical protein